MATQTENKKQIVWLKYKAYVSDKQRLNPGVYSMVKIPERLLKLSGSAIEIFEKVPSSKLAQIARWAGMNPDGMEDEEILKKVIGEPKPY